MGFALKKLGTIFSLSRALFSIYIIWYIVQRGKAKYDKKVSARSQEGIIEGII